jgi:hypothetical protein
MVSIKARLSLIIFFKLNVSLFLVTLQDRRYTALDVYVSKTLEISHIHIMS